MWCNCYRISAVPSPASRPSDRSSALKFFQVETNNEKMIIISGARKTSLNGFGFRTSFFRYNFPDANGLCVTRVGLWSMNLTFDYKAGHRYSLILETRTCDTFAFTGWQRGVCQRRVPVLSPHGEDTSCMPVSQSLTESDSGALSIESLCLAEYTS